MVNRIILIGNGFDLAHGLKTSYADFISDFWMGKIKEFVGRRDGVFEDSEGYIKIYGGTPLVPTDESDNEQVRSEKIDLNFVMIPMYNAEQLKKARSRVEARISQWEEEKKEWFLDEFKAILEEHKVVIGYKNTFLKEISEKRYQKWVDIEEVYYKQMVSLLKDTAALNEEEVSRKIEELNKAFEGIKKALEEYLDQEEKRKSIPESDECIKPEKYIKQNIYSSIEPKEVMSIGKDDIEPGESLLRSQRNDGRPENILFLNFNYTKTGELYLDNDRTSEVLHIHGRLKDIDNPIIFGYGDELDDRYPAIEKTNDNRFLENVKSIRYLETDNYKRLLNFVESDSYQICVFGHSCGISDRTLLNTLFEHKNCVSIKVFYHQKEDGTDNYSDVVRNISRSFTDKAAMREKVVNKKYCKPLKGKSQQE
jgi:hypothetical protein